MSKHKYSWKPDLPDHRDHYFALRLPTASLPTSVDLRPGTPTSFNQQQLGSCTANAIAGAIKFDQAKQKLFPTYVPSRLFIYFNERTLEGTVSQDAGAMLRDGIKAVAKWGAPPETLWPYDTTKFAVTPPASVFTAGAKHLAVSYQRVNQDAQSMQSCLANGYPFVIGFSVYESFESEAVAATGIVPMPGPNEQQLGGHAVLCVGYNATTSTVNGAPPNTFICHNSWGPAWGASGNFFIPMPYLLDANLADDFWTIRQIQ